MITTIGWLFVAMIIVAIVGEPSVFLCVGLIIAGVSIYLVIAGLVVGLLL